MLAKKSLQWSFTQSLIEAALKRNVFLNEHILVEGGKSIKMDTLLKSRYFKHTVKKVTNQIDYKQNCKADILRKKVDFARHQHDRNQ